MRSAALLRCLHPVVRISVWEFVPLTLFLLGWGKTKPTNEEKANKQHETTTKKQREASFFHFSSVESAFVHRLVSASVALDKNNIHTTIRGRWNGNSLTHCIFLIENLSTPKGKQTIIDVDRGFIFEQHIINIVW